MRQRTLGNTQLSVSELSLGTWGLSGEAYGPVLEADATRVMERALAMGITLFETADSYAGGRMEKTLGEVLAGSDSVVVTKWGTDLASSPPRKRFSPSFLRQSAEASKERIGAAPKVIGLLHNPSTSALKEGAAETMADLVREGVIASWGVSIGDSEVGAAALDVGAPIVSLPHNILHVTVLRPLSDRLREAGTGVLAHSSLFYGLLAGRWAPNKDFRSYDHRAERWAGGSLRARISQLDAVRPLVSGDVTTMRSAAVRFVLQHDIISSVILGPHAPSQLDQLVRECKGEPPYLSSGKMSSLEGRLRELEVPR